MVRTRFAPSPTGYLHIGGVRTALFYWLFARRHGGQFLLRIDDTDAERNVEAALAPILHGFRWLGIDWDEGPEVGGPYAPYYQSQRLPRYQAAVEKLLAAGFAYRDYATTEEMQAEREAAQREKRPFLYSRRWMAETPDRAERIREPKAGKPSCGSRCRARERSRSTISFAARSSSIGPASKTTSSSGPTARACIIWPAWSTISTFEITHVIRAEEHLSNTPRQMFIAQSLGYPLPEYAHLPFVAEPGSKNKLSKRKLDKYLKNRDFAQIDEHGLAIAERAGAGRPRPRRSIR